MMMVAMDVVDEIHQNARIGEAEIGVNEKVGADGNLAAPARFGCGVHIQSHLQIQRNAKLVVLQFLDADDFGQIFAVHGVMRRGKRKRNENPHALIIVRAPRREINPMFRSVYAGGQIFKMIIPRVRRTYPQLPGNFGTPGATQFRTRRLDGRPTIGFGASLVHFFQLQGIWL